MNVLLPRIAGRDCRFPNARQCVYNPFNVFGEDIEALRRHDHLFLAAADIKMSVAMKFSEIARVQPASHDCLRSSCWFAVIAGHDVCAAHQNLAVGGNLDVNAGQRLPNRAAAGMERMVECDNGRSLSQPIALHDEKTEAGPEVFRLPIESRSADHESQEPKAKKAVTAPISPEALQETGSVSCGTSRFRS